MSWTATSQSLWSFLKGLNPVNKLEKWELEKRVIELERQNVEKDRIIQRRDEFRLVGQFYKRDGDEADYCPKCLKACGIEMPVSPRVPNNGGIKRDCPNCHNVYWEEQPKENQSKIAIAFGSFPRRSRWPRLTHSDGE